MDKKCSLEIACNHTWLLVLILTAWTSTLSAWISNTWAFQSLIDLSHVNGNGKKKRDREGKSNIRKQMEKGLEGGNSR